MSQAQILDYEQTCLILVLRLSLIPIVVATVIGIIVSNILLAMGMMMVSPVTISLPFKLLLFVMVNGWTMLIQGLVRGYLI